ncbi:MAG: thiamine-binding protein [Segetibacter sp.]|nr:thiamine-binding protein [Segetibacter sp.]
MHNHIINASLQIIPIVQDKHPYEWVDEAILIIQQSGIKHEVGPFATVLEGTYTEVMKVVDDVNEHLLNKECTEWIANVQIQLRSNGDITSNEKVVKFIS